MSKKFLQEALAKGTKKTIKTHKGEETGKFGRILGEIFVDGKNVNMEMCKKGYAVAYYGQNKDLVEGQHLKNRKKLGA